MNQRSLPSNAEYREFLAHPQMCLKDAELRSCTPELDRLGFPRIVTGNFAAVFRLNRPGGGPAWAVKCFTRQLPDAQRYRRISQVLAPLSDTWKMRFEYLEDGVRILDRTLPLLKMEWVQGAGLDRYVKSHLGDPASLSLLAIRFAEVIASLERAGVAHGDLQHGNILVADDGTLRLVDYDGMFVPGMEGLPPVEEGLANYQSPHRGPSHFGPFLDRFSAWVIYGSLVALAVRPDLWDRRSNDEALLFSRDDYERAGSVMLTHLEGTGDERCRALADKMRELCLANPERIPPLSPILVPPPLDYCSNCNGVRDVDWTTRTCRSCGGVPGPRAAVGTAGLPDWIRERMGPAPAPVVVAPPRTPAAAAPAVPVAAAPSVPPASVASSLPVPAAQLRFSWEALWFARISFMVLVLAYAACVLKAVTSGSPDGTVDPQILTALFIGITAVAVCAGYRVSFDRAALRLRQERAHKTEEERARIVQQLETERLRTRVDVERITADLKSEIRDIDAEEASAQVPLRSEVSRVERMLADLEREVARKTKDVGAQRESKTRRPAELAQQEQKEIADAERQRFASAMSAQLQRTSIHSAAIAGVGEVVKAALHRHGFTCAADLIGIQITVDPQYQTEKALLRRRDGVLVRVPGIGPKKAQALDVWRQNVAARAPNSSPGASSEAIRAKYGPMKALAEVQAMNAAKEAARALADLAQWHKAERASLQQKLQRARQALAGLSQRDYESRRQALRDRMQRLIQERQDQAAAARVRLEERLRAAEVELATASADLAGCAHLNFGGFLQALLGR